MRDCVVWRRVFTVVVGKVAGAADPRRGSAARGNLDGEAEGCGLDDPTSIHGVFYHRIRKVPAF